MPAVEVPGPPEQADGPFSAREQAAEWFALLRSGEATNVDRSQWEAWLAASEEHRNAWSYVERVSRRFAPIQASPDPRSTADVLQTARERLARRRQILLGLTAFGSGVLGWAVWRNTPLPDWAMAWMADHHTGVGETREIRLADGTRVWLGPASAFSQDFRPDLRRLHRVAGDVFIETAADAARPFVVDTTHGRLRALGTRFNVRLEGRQTAVSVYEGAVEVRTATSNETVVVHGGQQTRFDQNTVEGIAPADPAREGWTQGILIAQDMPLSQVAAELARYRHGHLGVAPEMSGLGVYGSFPLNDTDRALAMLAAILPIQVRQPLPWWSTIEARHDPAGKAPGR